MALARVGLHQPGSITVYIDHLGIRRELVATSSFAISVYFETDHTVILPNKHLELHTTSKTMTESHVLSQVFPRLDFTFQAQAITV